MSQPLINAIYKGSVLVLLWLAGFYMRLPILAAAPLGPRINAEFGLSQSTLGALTTLPVLLLGLGALPASLLMARIGARNTVVLALLITALASGARGVAPDTSLLLLYTGFMGLGIAAMQPSLAALVPRWCPRYVALGSAVYLNGMMLSEFAGAGLTLPFVLPLAGDSWRVAFILWSVPALFIALALLYPKQHGAGRATGQARALPAFNDGQLWRFGLLLGTVSATFFGSNAYMASVLSDKAMSGWLNSALVALNLSQVAASLLLLTMPRRVLAIPRLLCVSVSLVILGLAGFLLLPGTGAVVATAVIGFGCALQMISLTMLPPLLRPPDEAGKLAAGMFAVGYCLAFLLPLGAGAIADLSTSTQTALWLLVTANVVCIPIAWYTRIQSISDS